MKVQMIAQISGTRDGVSWPETGGTLECPEDEGAQLIASRLAKPWEKPSKVETAAAPTAKVETRKGMTKDSTGL